VFSNLKDSMILYVMISMDIHGAVCTNTSSIKESTVSFSMHIVQIINLNFLPGMLGKLIC